MPPPAPIFPRLARVLGAEPVSPIPIPAAPPPRTPVDERAAWESQGSQLRAAIFRDRNELVRLREAWQRSRAAELGGFILPTPAELADPFYEG